MSEYLIGSSKDGDAENGFTSNCLDETAKAEPTNQGKKSLQLLISYLKFCSEQNISSRLALDILDECSADLGVIGASSAAFVEAFYRAADLGNHGRS